MLATFRRSMTRLVTSFFALGLAAGFTACEQHTADSLPPHYREKMEAHGGAGHDTKHPPITHPGETKDSNVGHKEAGQKAL
jgi:hypothetical protein